MFLVAGYYAQNNYKFRLFYLLYCQPDSELGMGVYRGAALGL